MVMGQETVILKNGFNFSKVLKIAEIISKFTLYILSKI